MQAPNSLSCAGGCKAQVADAEEASKAGWSFFPVIQRYRCASCERELQAASTVPGPEENPPDLLDPADRGALPMPGGFGVVPVMVKG
jgi:hypothetical protein